MSTVNERQEEIIEEFEGLDDWMDRYSVIIDMGNAMPALDEQYKTADNLIDGCQSRVWLQADCIDGKMRLQADSDAIIVKGIISMLVRVLDGATPGGARRRPVLHRAHRVEGTSLPHPQQWPAGHGETDPRLCHRLPGT